MPDPYVIEHRTNDRRGCLLTLTVMALIVIGQILGAMVSSGDLRKVCAVGGLFGGWFFGIGLIQLWLYRWQGLPHRIEIDNARIVVSIPQLRRRTVINQQTTVRWSPRWIRWRVGDQTESLFFWHYPSSDRQRLIRAFREVVPGDQQSDWELFAFLTLIPDELQWSAYPREAFTSTSTRRTTRISIILTLVSVAAALILSLWLPERRFELISTVLVANALIAVFLQWVIRKMPPEDVAMNWQFQFVQPRWVVIGLGTYGFGLVIARFPPQFPAFLLPLLCFTAGFALFLRGVSQSDATYRNYQRQLAAKVVPAWETQWLKQDLDSPPAITPG